MPPVWPSPHGRLASPQVAWHSEAVEHAIAKLLADAQLLQQFCAAQGVGGAVPAIRALLAQPENQGKVLALRLGAAVYNPAVAAGIGTARFAQTVGSRQGRLAVECAAAPRRVGGMSQRGWGPAALQAFRLEMLTDIHASNPAEGGRVVVRPPGTGSVDCQLNSEWVLKQAALACSGGWFRLERPEAAAGAPAARQ